MSGPIYEIVSRLMKAVIGRRITVPGTFKRLALLLELYEHCVMRCSAKIWGKKVYTVCSFYQQWFVTNLDFVGPCLLVLKVVADNQMKYRRGAHTVQFSQVKFNHSYSKNSFTHFRLKMASKGVETSLAVTHFHCKISFKETTFTVLKLNCLCSTRFFFHFSSVTQE